jgi:hypothetical protein
MPKSPSSAAQGEFGGGIRLSLRDYALAAKAAVPSA